jgi:hypothetical protein
VVFCCFLLHIYIHSAMKDEGARRRRTKGALRQMRPPVFSANGGRRSRAAVRHRLN